MRVPGKIRVNALLKRGIKENTLEDSLHDMVSSNILKNRYDPSFNTNQWLI